MPAATHDVDGVGDVAGEMAAGLGSLSAAMRSVSIIAVSSYSAQERRRHAAVDRDQRAGGDGEVAADEGEHRGGDVLGQDLGLRAACATA